MKVDSMPLKQIGIFTSAFIMLVSIFFFGFPSPGRDWRVMSRGLERFVTHQPLYTASNFGDEPHVFYLPPWYVLPLSPIAFFNVPDKLVSAVFRTLSIFAIIPLAKRYNLSIIHIILIYISPPFLYNLQQGNIDILLLLVVFAPREIWPLICLAKPHVVGGMPFALITDIKVWLKTALISGSIILLSFYFFGLWPLQILEQSNLADLSTTPHNQLKYLYPLQLIVAVALFSFGFERKDERYFMSASPFLLSYATIGNFMGLAISVISAMKWWQAAALVMTWWIALVFS